MKSSIKAKIKRILSKDVIDGKQAGRAVLLNLVYLTQYGDTYLTEEDYLKLIDGLQTPTAQKIYGDYVYINHALIDARNTIYSYFEIAKRNSKDITELLRKMGTNEAALKRIEAIPLLIPTDEYRELEEKALETRGALKLSFSQVLYLALRHYLPYYMRHLKEIRQGEYGLIPPDIVKSFLKYSSEKTNKQEAIALMPVLKTAIGMYRRKIDRALPSDVKREEEARTESAIISIFDGIYSKTKSASISDTIEIIDKELTKTREAKHDTEELNKVKNFKIDIFPALPSLEGVIKIELLKNLEQCGELSNAFFSFPYKISENEDFELKELCLEAFKTVYPSLYEALASEVEKLLPMLKGAEKEPFNPVISLQEFKDNSPFSLSEFFHLNEMDKMLELPSEEKKQALERGLAVVIHSSSSIYNKSTMAVIETRHLLASDFTNKSRRKVVQMIKNDKNYADTISNAYVDVLERMKFLTAYSLLIKEFGKAQRVPEIESFDFDTKTIQLDLDEGNELLREELCHVYFDYGRNTAILIGNTFRLIEPTDYALQEDEKARIIELARSLEAMAEGSILSSLLRALHGNKKR